MQDIEWIGLYRYAPAAVNGFAFVHIIFGDGTGRNFLHPGYLQMVHAGLEILVVGGKKQAGIRPKQSNHRFQEAGMVPGDIEDDVAGFGGGVGGGIHHCQVEALVLFLGGF